MATALAQAPLTRQRERIFYVSMAVLAACVVFAGFARTYFLKDVFGAPSLSPLVHLHGFLFSSWIVMLIAQTSLVAAHRTRVHMRLGIAGAILAGLMVVVGPLTAITAVKLGKAPGLGIPPLVFLSIPLFDIAVFATLVGTGLYLRRRTDHHKRLMLAGTIAILPAAFARFPIAFLHPYQPHVAFVLTDIVLLSAVVYDTVRHRRLHPAFVWASAVIVLSYPLRLMVAGTSAWLSFARWLTS